MATLEAILEGKAKGLSQNQIANELGTSVGSVAGKLRRHKQSHARVQDSKVLNFPSLPKPQIVKRPENEGTDLARWESELSRLWLRRDKLSIMHMNDLHLPYYDSAALTMWLELAKRFKPNVVVVGSDMFDLPSISRFERDPDISVDDWQERSREHYWPVVHQLDRLLPHALIVWIYGNHEHRALRDIKFSSMPKVGMSYFLETVRCGGRVMHVGRTEHVEIGGLIVAHGNKTGKFAADKMGTLWPHKVVNFGHIHKYQAIGNGYSNGKLCQPPFYEDWRYPNPETIGTHTMLVETAESGKVLMNYHDFVESEGALWTVYGDSLISVDRQAYAESEAA